jgi:tetratricopeptide (TPR) repeat protein
MEQALTLDPDNGYAHRNLAAILGSIGEQTEAIVHLREAYRLLPTDQASVFGLAHALEAFGDTHDRAEADRLYKATIELDPGSDFGERARQARSGIAERQMRALGAGPGGTGPRSREARIRTAGGGCRRR